MSLHLSVVLLCHNELENLPGVLSQVTDALLRIQNEGHADTAEVIVVDDGSTDGTEEWLAKEQNPIPLSVVRHKTRMGYGAAVRSGLDNATGDLVAYMDGDGQFEAIQLMDMIVLMGAQKADMVAGIRAERNDNFYRRSVGWMYNAAVRQCLNLNFEDVDCGFKLLTRSALEQIDLQLNGNLMGAEIFNQLKAAGATIVQMPVRHHTRKHGKAKGVDAYSLWATVLDLWKSATNR